MDNFYKHCPPVMSDGRLFTDYRSNIRVNEYLKYVNGINRDDDYRLFLQSNAEKILDDQWENEVANKLRSANDCVHNYPTTMSGSLFREERIAADSKEKTNGQYPCRKFRDYRATVTKRV